MNINRQEEITGRVLAQNVLFFAVSSLFVAFGLLIVILWVFFGIERLESMPKHEARPLVAWIYGLLWLFCVIAFSWHRFVQLFKYRDRKNEAMLLDKPIAGRHRSFAVWERKGFFARTYFLMDGPNKLFTLERKGDDAIMYSEITRLKIDAKQVVTDEATGQKLAMADLKAEQLMRAAANAGTIRCADGTIYTVGFTEGRTHLKAQNGAKFISIQAGTITIETNEDLTDKKVAALCLVLSSFLIQGKL